MRSPTWERWFALSCEERLFIVRDHFAKIDMQKIKLQILQEKLTMMVEIEKQRQKYAESHD